MSMYYIKEIDKGISKNGSKYLKLTLVDTLGKSFVATCFTENPFSDAVGKVIQSAVDSTEKYPNVQESELVEYFTLESLPIIPDVFKRYLHSLPTKEEWSTLIKDILDLSNKSQSKLGVQLMKDSEELYSLYSQNPAAKAMHHAYPGGLLQHTFEILKLFKAIYSGLSFKVNPIHCLIGILYHDWGKCQEYSEGDYTEIMPLTPHGFLGAQEVGRRYQAFLKPRTLSLIQHIILSHHGRLEWGATTVPATLEAFLVHHLDCLSGHGNAMSNCVNMEKCFATNTFVVES